MNLVQSLRRTNRRLRGSLGTLGTFGRLRPPLFVVGSPNSGTRALAEAIAVHPEICDRSELRMLWDEDFHDRNHDTRRIAQDVTERDRRRLRGNLAWYQWIGRARVLMNRHPENCVRIPFLHEIFPDATVVHIVRDGRAAICSNFLSATSKPERQRRPFGGYIRPPGWREWLHRPPLEQLAFMWNESVLLAAADGAALGERFVEVRYEALAENAAPHIARIWQAVGLAAPAELLAQLPPFDNRNQKWRKAFTADQVKAVEAIAGPGLRHYEYTPADGPDNGQR